MYHHQFQYAWLKVHEKKADSGERYASSTAGLKSSYFALKICKPSTL